HTHCNRSRAKTRRRCSRHWRRRRARARPETAPARSQSARRRDLRDSACTESTSARTRAPPTDARAPPSCERSRRGATARLAASCAELELAEAEHRHAQKQPAVLEPADLGVAVRARAIAHRHLDDFQARPGGAEEQIEITERIEIAEVRPPGDDL